MAYTLTHTPVPIALTLAGIITLMTPGGCAAAPTVSEQIMVDQFGWRAGAPRKVAVFANPVKGQNAAHAYTPGPTFQIRRVADNTIVFTGNVAPWHNGDINPQSGDRAWWGDFSALRTPGHYVVFDPQNNLQSYNFAIRDDVYHGVLQASLRTFYYQRCGLAITAATGGQWTHEACHVGAGQDRSAQLLRGGKPQGQPRDVSGGWHDAGDYNHYVPFLTTTMWNLMMAYELHPAAFDDDEGIPESHNGVPDVLDEVKWELDWLLKMQLDDGSVCNRVVALTYNIGDNPAHDVQPRYYTPPTTWATAVFAAVTAHGARLYPAFEKAYPGYAARLRDAAEKAWAYLEQHPAMLPADGQDGAGQTASAPGSSDAHTDKRLRILAAAELFKTTGNARYGTFFETNYADKDGTSDNGSQPFASNSFDPSRTQDLNQACYVYATAPGANPAVVSRIKETLRNSLESNLVPAYQKGDDPYRAYMWDGHYCWGSNQLKANWALLAVMAAQLNVNPAHTPLYRELAEEYLHYFHGRNPLCCVYLSNMGAKGANLGAGKSLMDIFHGWFNSSPQYHGPDSTFGPAPGYLAGGPNQFFSKDWISPPHGEPAMKAFRDWSGAWNAQRQDNEDSWEITEPAIYYQAAYTLILSSFCGP